jgi:hypothetical protein
MNNSIGRSKSAYYAGRVCTYSVHCTKSIEAGVYQLKGLSHEIDFENVDENGQIFALIRAAAGF